MMIALEQMSRSTQEAYDKYKAAMEGPLWDDTMEQDIPLTVEMAKRVFAYYTDGLKRDNGSRVAYDMLEVATLYQAMPKRDDTNARICMYLRGLVHAYRLTYVITAEKGADIWQSDEIVPLHDMAIRWKEGNGEEVIVIETKERPSEQSMQRFREYCAHDQYWILDWAGNG